jgi:hypothetical protein
LSISVNANILISIEWQYANTGCRSAKILTDFHLQEIHMKSIVKAAAIAAIFASSTVAAESFFPFGDDNNSNWNNDGYGYGYGDGSGRGKGSGEFTMNFSGKADADMDTNARTDFYGANDGRFYNYNTPYGYAPYYGAPVAPQMPAPAAPAAPVAK